MYKVEYSEKLQVHMSQGLSFESFASVVDCHRDTLYQWVKVYPDFSDAKKRGTDLSLKWWEEMGKRGMIGDIPRFNATIWIFNMKNRFRWRDSQSSNEANEKPSFSLDDLSKLSDAELQSQ